MNVAWGQLAHKTHPISSEHGSYWQTGLSDCSYTRYDKVRHCGSGFSYNMWPDGTWAIAYLLAVMPSFSVGSSTKESTILFTQVNKFTEVSYLFTHLVIFITSDFTKTIQMVKTQHMNENYPWSLQVTETNDFFFL